LYAVRFISVSQTTAITVKWFSIPTVIIAVYYAYRSSFGYHKATAVRKNTLVFIIMTLMIGMVTFVSLEGSIMLINKNIGQQKECVVSGKIIKVNYPAVKKVGNKYSIVIERMAEKDTLELNVPTNEYTLNQNFERQMKTGCLNILYSE